MSRGWIDTPTGHPLPWPAEILIEFRTQSPQYTATNLLVALDEFLTVIRAREVRLEVGGVAVRLRGDQLEALRDFALQVRDRGRGDS